jgi:hypothetical protein
MLPLNYVVPVAMQHLVDCSVEKHDALEDITYPVITEFLLVHKSPSHRFTLYSQMTLRWNPDRVRDFRSEIPDVGLVNFRRNHPFIFRLGVESKRMTSAMANLPPCNILEGDLEVRFALHTAYFQAEDQAKAAMRRDHASPQRPMDYFLFVGPYWTHVTVGPFSEAQLTVRTHKPSGSRDFWETVQAEKRLNAEPVRRKLFLLGTAESAFKMESVIMSTDDYGEPAMQEAVTYPAWYAQQ